MDYNMLALPIIVLLGAALMIAERIHPDQELQPVNGWWGRVIILNILQLSIVILGSWTWEHWFENRSLFSLKNGFSVPLQIAFAYVTITFVYYWWHRVRHDWNFLWLTCHQLHHSPSRIETITSFYKHPVELVINGILISAICFGVLGVNTTSGAGVTLVTACAEFFYHMNIKTPHWVGYFLQRPEMHRIHHQRGKHYNNFADLPLWDILFGTYENPPSFSGKCGFAKQREQEFWKMMAFKNVNKPFPTTDDDSGTRTS